MFIGLVLLAREPGRGWFSGKTDWADRGSISTLMYLLGAMGADFSQFIVALSRKDCILSGANSRRALFYGRTFIWAGDSSTNLEMGFPLPSFSNVSGRFIYSFLLACDFSSTHRLGRFLTKRTKTRRPTTFGLKIFNSYKYLFGPPIKTATTSLFHLGPL